MWKLKKLNEDQAICLVSEKHSYGVGRKNCDIPLDEDSSVSRKHCTIRVSKKSACKFPVTTLTGVSVVDEQSKYGTFVNAGREWEKLKAGEEKNLQNGWTVRFGVLKNIWSLVYSPIIACTSGIQNEGKQIIQSLLKSIDGELRNSWSNECTLVIVNEITLTVKVVLALINGVPIVTVDYVKKLIEAVKTNQSPPAYKDYRPVIKESALDPSQVCLDENKIRRELFHGLTFVFPTKKQLDTLREVIVSAGGEAVLLSFSGSLEKLRDRNIVVCQLPSNKSGIPDQVIAKFQEITSFLKKKCGKRIVPESEIAQAIAYSSVDKYCNTMSNSLEMSSSSNKKTDLGRVLVEETPDMTQKIIPEPCVIPCTSTSASDSLDDLTFEQASSKTPRKRLHSPNSPEKRAKVSRREPVADDASSEKPETDPESRISQSHVPETRQGSQQTVTSDDRRAKNSLITSYFGKESKAPSKESSLDDQQHSSSFWSTSTANSNHKRKLSSDTNDASDGSSSSKKAKFPTELPSEPLQSSSETRVRSRPAVRTDKPFQAPTRPPVEATDCFDDFIETDKTDSITQSKIQELNNTIYSLSLISTIYLNEDGSLVDPPNVPVNVKKFKKQKVFTVDVTAGGDDDDVDSGAWLEPHPLDSSVGKKVDW